MFKTYDFFAQSVTAFLFINFLSFPFFFRNLSPLGYSAIWITFFLLSFFAGVLRPSVPFELRATFQPLWTRLFLLFYALYVMALFIPSVIAIVSDGDVQMAKDLVTKLIVILTAFFIAAFLSTRHLLRALKWYANLTTLFSLLGIVLVVLVFLHKAPLLSHVEMSNNSIRDFYGLGFVWPDTWIGGHLGLERLQSYSDEAGTFAFAALPAILLSFHYNQRWKFSILLTSVFLTFSVGAWLFLIGLGLVYLVRHVAPRKKLMALALTAVLVGALGVQIARNQLASDFALAYISAKIGGTDEHTSTGDRIDDLRVAYEMAETHPIGLGVNGYRKSNVALAIGWIVPVVESGVTGWFCYLAAFSIVLWQAWRLAWSDNGLIAKLAIILLAMGFAALQRGGMDATLWHWTWLVAFFRLYNCQNSEWNLVGNAPL